MILPWSGCGIRHQIAAADHDNMKNYGWDIKYGFYTLGALILTAPLFLFAPFLLLVSIALLLIVSGVKQLNKYHSLNKWEKVQGALIQKDIGKYKVSNGGYSYPYEYYFPLAYFSYSFRGQTYKSNEYSFDRKSIWSTDKDAINTILEGLVVGEAVTVFVNPDQPEIAVLNTKISKQRKSHSYALIAAGVLLIITGSVAWYYS